MRASARTGAEEERQRRRSANRLLSDVISASKRTPWTAGGPLFSHSNSFIIFLKILNFNLFFSIPKIFKQTILRVAFLWHILPKKLNDFSLRYKPLP